MKASANYICKNGGDILEIGFGMGISANHIQANDINSHTIVENHPQVIEKLKAWAQDKSNVIIVEGDWYQVKDSLSTYDGVFYDTYGEGDWTKFSEEISSLVKPGAKVTWWNNEPSTNSIQNIDGVDYEGYYHIHPHKGAMRGKRHSEAAHDVLQTPSQWKYAKAKAASEGGESSAGGSGGGGY